MPITKVINTKKVIEINIHSINISFKELKFNESISVYVDYFDIDNKFLYNETITIAGEEYNNWNDDGLLIELIMQKLNLELPN